MTARIQPAHTAVITTVLGNIARVGNGTQAGPAGFAAGRTGASAESSRFFGGSDLASTGLDAERAGAGGGDVRSAIRSASGMTSGIGDGLGMTASLVEQGREA